MIGLKFYGKNIIFYVKIQNLQKIIPLIIFFAIEFFLTIASNQFLKIDWIFMNHALFFEEDILCNSTVSNFKSKFFSIAEIVRRIFFKK